MAKKRKNKKTKLNLNKEIVIKTTRKKLIIGALINSIIISIIIGLFFTKFNEASILLLKEFNTLKEVINLLLYLLPLIIIIELIAVFVKITIYENK